MRHAFRFPGSIREALKQHIEKAVSGRMEIGVRRMEIGVRNGNWGQVYFLGIPSREERQWL